MNITNRKFKDYIAENEGWKLDSEYAWSAWESLKEYMGPEEAGDELARALSLDELADNIVYICRQHDLELAELEDEEVDFEDSTKDNDVEGINTEKLIKEEEDADKSYEHEIENATSKKGKKLLRHIQKEELEHKKEIEEFEEDPEGSEIMDQDLTQYNKYMEMIESGHKLNERDGMRKATEYNQSGKKATIIIKIPNQNYQKWFDENKDNLKTTIEEETTYVTSPREKAFNPKMGGYSIFARSLGSLKRDADYVELDRIEHIPFEWMMIIDEE